MKLLKPLLLLSFIAAITISACKKDENNNSSSTGPTQNNTNNTSSGTFYANINGTPFSSSNVRAEMMGDWLSIAAVVGKAGFGIGIVNPKLGQNTLYTYNSQAPLASYTIYLPDTLLGPRYYSIDNSVINITSFNTAEQTMSGSFEFTMKDSLGNQINVTSGIFTIKYKQVGGTLKYTVDGQSHNDNAFAIKHYRPLYDSLFNPIDSISVISITSNTGSNYPNLDISMPTAIAIGTYDIKKSANLPSFDATLNLSAQAYYYISNFDTESSGTLTIIQNTAGAIKGSFSLNLKGYNGGNPTSKSVTNGSFDVKY